MQFPNAELYNEKKNTLMYIKMQFVSKTICLSGKLIVSL